jgi:GT2 family glycosyltransferase
MQISIIIPNLNGEEFLPACLKSLKTAIDQAKIDAEIILVDNASTDASPEIFTSFCQNHKIKYQLLSLNKNYGFAGAVNRGVEVAKSDWVLVCNNDLKIDKYWFVHTTQLLNYSTTKLAAITGTVLNYDGSRFESQGLKFHYSGKCDNISNGQPYSTTSLKNYSTNQLIWGASAALTLYNKKIFTQVGGFDEDFFAYLEDVDLSLRFNKAGYKTLYVPKAISYHLGGATTLKMGNFRQKQTVKNWIYIILKNYSTTQLLIYFPFILIERLRNLSGLIKNTPLKDIPRDVFRTYGEVIKTIPKILL